ncbi:MAG TPA: hypothetical protein VHD56_10210 [Tepidisphaeraceae bacterium]|nr:hypothetical protein [Tepidisphaeraceae bacterium]
MTENRFLGLTLSAWTGFVLGIASASACWAAVGLNLGLFFGGIIAASLLTPPLTLGEKRLIERYLVAGAVVDGIAVIWLAAVFGQQVTLSQWALCYVILIAWSFALCGLTMLILRTVCLFHLARRENTPGDPRSVDRGLNDKSQNPSVNPTLSDSTVSSAIVVVLAMLWLSWPIWLSQINTPVLISAHPLFAINGMLRNFGAWPERPIAYRYLMRLGQDLPYTLPRNIGPMIAVHLLIGAIGLIAGYTAGKR